MHASLRKIQALRFRDAPFWPTPLRLMAAALLGMLAWLLLWQWQISGQQSEQAQITHQNRALKNSYRQKVQVHLALEKLQASRRVLTLQKTALLEQLPGADRMSALIERVAQMSMESGLQLISFELGDASAQSLYTSLPFSMKLRGDYHDFGTFFSALSSLFEPVTLHDFRIQSTSEVGSFLHLSIYASAYHLVQAPL